MKKSLPATSAVTRMTPSAPMPNRRSHSTATSSEDSARSPSRSSSMTKSLPVPWYFQTRSSVTMEVPRQLVHHVDRAALAGGEPPDAGVSSEPDHLASGQFPRPPHRLSGCLRKRQLTPEVSSEFSVPDGPTSGQPSEQTLVEELPHLVDQAGIDHRVDARLDTPSQDVAWNVDPRGPNAFVWVALPPGRVARERAPGDRGHLECPDGPSDIGRLDAGGGGRIELLQAAMQAIRSENLGLGQKLLAGVRIGCGELELIDDRPEGHARAPEPQTPTHHA